MSKRSEILFEAIGEVRDDLLDEAARPENLKKKTPWLRYGAMAAALVLVVGVGVRVIPGIGMGGAEAPNAGASGSGSDGASEFMSYAGPVFPLTLREENAGVTAERKLTLDFSPWEPTWISNEMQLEEARGYGATEEELTARAEDLKRWYPEGGYYDKGTDLLIKDEYVLTNSTETDQTVEIMYPFASSLRDYMARKPVLRVDGSVCPDEIAAGDYAGGFRGAGGPNDGRLNLDQPASWEDYRSALTHRDYLEEALSEFPDLSGIPVTLYTFTEPWGEIGKNNVSIKVAFEMEEEKTTLLSLNFHMGWGDEGDGRRALGFGIPPSWRKDYGQPYYLIVIGEDIRNVEISGFTDGMEENGTAEAGVTILREETNLDAALRLAAQRMYEDDWMFGETIEADFELYYGLLCEYLLNYSTLSDDPVERYVEGWLDMVDFEVVERIFYTKTAVTIPANGSVTVTAGSTKEASFDYACTGSDNVGVSGYDAVTALGSNLNFTAQTARLEDRGQIAVVRQNFGFDLEQGIREVELDLETEHYYLEVRRVTDGN